ncbi:PH domain-containing protein [Cellulomonas hominis]|uniref:PH domain-containing protein n=1 Tax=Cellulomonas hominis TaxID=156981 RepID=UPI001B99FFF0|nr:PH domain-containing protein [Cellulomonas hominis]VTR76373.1 hypothetical protein CHMI_01133 [Cellulomonas hominis]
MAALFVGQSAHRLPWASAGVAVLAVALVVRTALIGVDVDDRGVRCVSWFMTRRVARDQIQSVRAVGYSGFANGFSDSGYLSMLEIRPTTGRTIIVRGLVGRAAMVKAVARRVGDECRTAEEAR